MQPNKRNFTRLLTIPRLIKWLKTKPRNKKHNCCDNNNCILAQFFRAHGLEVVAGVDYVRTPNDSFRIGIPRPIADAVYDPTFGEVLTRLEGTSS